MFLSWKLSLSCVIYETAATFACLRQKGRSVNQSNTREFSLTFNDDHATCRQCSLLPTLVCSPSRGGEHTKHTSPPTKLPCDCVGLASEEKKDSISRSSFNETSSGKQLNVRIERCHAKRHYFSWPLLCDSREDLMSWNEKKKTIMNTDNEYNRQEDILTIADKTDETCESTGEWQQIILKLYHNVPLG